MRGQEEAWPSREAMVCSPHSACVSMGQPHSWVAKAACVHLRAQTEREKTQLSLQAGLGKSTLTAVNPGAAQHSTALPRKTQVSTSTSEGEFFESLCKQCDSCSVNADQDLHSAPDPATELSPAVTVAIQPPQTRKALKKGAAGSISSHSSRY